MKKSKQKRRARLLYATGDIAKEIRRSTERVRQLEAAGKIHAAFRTPCGQRLFELTELNRLKKELVSSE